MLVIFTAGTQRGVDVGHSGQGMVYKYWLGTSQAHLAVMGTYVTMEGAGSWWPTGAE